MHVSGVRLRRLSYYGSGASTPKSGSTRCQPRFPEEVAGRSASDEHIAQTEEKEATYRDEDLGRSGKIGAVEVFRREE